MTNVQTGMSGFDQAVHYLGRQLFLSLCKERGYTDIDPVPHVPRWANEYAQIAVGYLGYTDESITQLAKDYK